MAVIFCSYVKIDRYLKHERDYLIRWVMNNIRKPFAVALLGLLGLAGCATTPPEYVSMKMPELKVQMSNDGVPVPKIETTETLSYLSAEEASVAAKDFARLSDNDSAERFFGKPVASPQQDAFVYYEYSAKGGKVGSKILRQSFNSKSVAPIGSGLTLDLTPAYTPDGQFLIFSSDRSGDAQRLWRVRADGAGGVTQITSSTSFDSEPSVAADGETVVFQSRRRGDELPYIWSVNVNGGFLTQLGQGESPRVSPDGRRIAFVRASPVTNKEQIWVMNIDGSGVTQLGDDRSDDIHPAWHPSGRFLVFASNAGKDNNDFYNYDIWIMRDNGTSRQRLTENGSRDDAPVFDRTGRTIIFRSNRGEAWNLYRFTPVVN